MEGVVGGYQLTDRGGSTVSQYPPWLLGRSGNGDHLPRSQVTSAADGDDGGGPLQNIPWPQEGKQHT